MSFTQNSVATLLKQPQNGKIQILNADAQNQKTVYTAGGNGSKVTGLTAVSTDTSARDVQISVTNGGTSYPISTVSVPAGAGNASGTVGVDLLNLTNCPGLPVDSDGNKYLMLISGDTLTVSALTTVTSGKAITCVAVAVGDF